MGFSVHDAAPDGEKSFVLSKKLRDDATMVTNMLHMELKRRLLLDEEGEEDSKGSYFTTLEQIAESDRTY